MNLEKFQKRNRKKQAIVVGGIVLILLVTVVMVYRSYAIYEQKQEYDVIQGQVPDQNYDVMWSYILEDEFGNRSPLNTIPEGRNYGVSVSCDNNATGVWDYDDWGVKVTNLTQTRTKCKVTFGPLMPLRTYGITDILVTRGTGIYEVSHSDAEITAELTEVQKNNLKMTEYRYAGSDPNNYLEFNGELWRIVGLLNTPEGQRLKIIRNESIGGYSWDSSESTVNSGYGINEWSQSKIHAILNENGYWNRSVGACYVSRYLEPTDCDFASTGLTDSAKNMIDTITWNLGTNGSQDYTVNGVVSQFYNYERSNNTGKNCSGEYCNDTVTRTTKWIGQVGLMYPSDYGYATSGGTTTNRTTCLNKSLALWNDTNHVSSDCNDNDWLFTSLARWTMTPLSSSSYGSYAFMLHSQGYIDARAVYNYSVFPVVYLKSDIKVISGQGTVSNPYKLV